MKHTRAGVNIAKKCILMGWKWLKVPSIGYNLFKAGKADADVESTILDLTDIINFKNMYRKIMSLWSWCRFTDADWYWATARSHAHVMPFHAWTFLPYVNSVNIKAYFLAVLFYPTWWELTAVSDARLLITTGVYFVVIGTEHRVDGWWAHRHREGFLGDSSAGGLRSPDWVEVSTVLCYS